MLKIRIISGTLMTIFFVAVVLLDGWIDLPAAYSAHGAPVRGTFLCILIAALIVPGQMEFSSLVAARGITIFRPFTSVCSIGLVTTWYWPQLLNFSADKYLAFVAAVSVAGLFLLQYLRFGTANVAVNCGANLFGIFYLGLFPAFLVLLRIERGIWPLLMFVAVVKCTDIGAYTAGSLWGKHKFSPRVSPKKTWEGMAGGIVFALAVALLFAAICGIMSLWAAVVFAVAFAFIGQLGDLAESLLKRDAQKKDASAQVPGFGGLLDVMDSPLLAAPLAYVFFTLFGS